MLAFKSDLRNLLAIGTPVAGPLAVAAAAAELCAQDAGMFSDVSTETSCTLPLAGTTAQNSTVAEANPIGF